MPHASASSVPFLLGKWATHRELFRKGHIILWCSINLLLCLRDLDLAINPLLHWGKPTSATHDIRFDESRGWLLNGLDLLQSSFLLWDRLRNWKPLVSPSILAGVTFLGVKYIASRIPRGRIKSPASFFLAGDARCSNLSFTLISLTLTLLFLLPP